MRKAQIPVPEDIDALLSHSSRAERSPLAKGSNGQILAGNGSKGQMAPRRNGSLGALGQTSPVAKRGSPLARGGGLLGKGELVRRTTSVEVAGRTIQVESLTIYQKLETKYQRLDHKPLETRS